MHHFLSILAQQNDNSGAATAGGMFGLAFGCCAFIVWFAIIAFVIVGLWKVFVKARQPGWAAIIPFFNAYILTLIAGRPILWFILLLLPVVNIVAVVVISLDIAKYFGRSPAFAVGLMLLPFVFYPILGFSNAQYSGPAKPF